VVKNTEKPWFCEEIRELREAGYGWIRISKVFGIPVSTIRGWYLRMCGGR